MPALDAVLTTTRRDRAPDAHTGIPATASTDTTSIPGPVASEAPVKRARSSLPSLIHGPVPPGPAQHLHHLDCPWRPADLAQRDGRIIRQGNANPEVQILRYVTEGSFDAYSWQTVARKAQFIAQVMRGRLDNREIEDIGDTALSYNEVKALATGNPLLLDHAQATSELTRLERLERGHHRAQQRLPDLITSAQASLRPLSNQQQALAEALRARRPTRAEAFEMTIAGRRCTERSEAKQSLLRRLYEFRESREIRKLLGGQSASAVQVARLGGLDLDARALVSTTTRERQLSLRIHGITGTEVTLTDADWTSPNHGLITRLENQLGELEKLRDQNEARIASAHTEIEHATGQLDTPFLRATELAAARIHLETIEQEMAGQTTATPPPPRPGPSSTTQPDNTAHQPPAEHTPRSPAARLAALSFSTPLAKSLQQQNSQPMTSARPHNISHPADQQRGNLER
jgi:hypothetical protein